MTWRASVRDIFPRSDRKNCFIMTMQTGDAIVALQDVDLSLEHLEDMPQVTDWKLGDPLEQ